MWELGVEGLPAGMCQPEKKAGRCGEQEKQLLLLSVSQGS